MSASTAAFAARSFGDHMKKQVAIHWPELTCFTLYGLYFAAKTANHSGFSDESKAESKYYQQKIGAAHHDHGHGH